MTAASTRTPDEYRCLDAATRANPTKRAERQNARPFGASAHRGHMTTTHSVTDPADLNSIAAAERLAQFALRQLSAGVELIDENLDHLADAAGMLNLAQSHTNRAVMRLAELVIRHTIRRELPDAVALELGTSGTSIGGVMYVPRRVIDADGQVLWTYREFRAGGEEGQPSWERVVVSCCESLRAVPVSADHLPLVGPTLPI